ncbi:hypothetical protein B9Z55_007381 [Caenorhabditis nigoni]|uniref:Uncharacterized protein n=1 Tax=Caenorhabditis nigoni TaxID=1611254 RepID=A0A2G5V9K5_9PELO|nr:hypothetical protein B9Z55_007381 [Caenorhabditis nigoni]
MRVEISTIYSEMLHCLTYSNPIKDDENLDDRDGIKVCEKASIFINVERRNRISEIATVTRQKMMKNSMTKAE